jgi:hypothetical protein
MLNINFNLRISFKFELLEYQGNLQLALSITRRPIDLMIGSGNRKFYHKIWQNPVKIKAYEQTLDSISVKRILRYKDNLRHYKKASIVNFVQIHYRYSWVVFTRAGLVSLAIEELELKLELTIIVDLWHTNKCPAS